MDYLNDEIEKHDERTEYVHLSVSPKVKKEFEAAENNSKLKEDIVRRFIKQETNWLKEEMLSIDEATIKYTGKLLTIKDKFSEAQDSYVEQIEAIAIKADISFRKINETVDSVDAKIEETKCKMINLNKQIENVKLDYFNTSGLDKLLDVVERFNSMGDKEKDLISALLNK